MNEHIKKPSDLETTYEAKRAGFLEIALRKNKESLPYIDEAKALKASVSKYTTPVDLLKDSKVKGPLAEAAGVSSKASNYLKEKDIKGIVEEFIHKYLEPAGTSFVEELIYRYLLSKGDALGGRMRNIVGALAGEKLTRYISAQLRNARLDHSFKLNSESKWKNANQITPDEMILVKAIRWKTVRGNSRELIYNIKVPVVGQKGNNIDISLFKKQTTSVRSPTQMKDFVSDPKNYLSLGELKGGIDPAGADEHWKTANTALQRIRASFKRSGNNVATFFIGAAIETSMAKEIYKQLGNQELTSAANLTNDDQLADLCSWIVQI